MRLHQATATRHLDWWVGFSSMAALLGLPGQLSYATANAWLDGFVAWQRASGQPATAISWGQWSDVGIGRSMTLERAGPHLTRRGCGGAPDAARPESRPRGCGTPAARPIRSPRPEFRDLGYFESVVAEADALQPAGGPRRVGGGRDPVAPFRTGRR